jgi:endonuclease/exonuclease/phosphatase (EEP) superfamily protein YafD
MTLAAVARLLAAAPIALTAMPLLRTGQGWVRIWDFPRLQIAALGLVSGAALRRWGRGTPADRVLGIGLAASIVYQAAKMVPYTRFYPPQVADAADVPPERRFRLFMANVLQENRRSDLMLAVIAAAAPDVICLVETDHWWAQATRALEREYPWVTRIPMPNHYGMCLFSKLPIKACEERYVVSRDVPSLRAILELKSGDEVVLYAVHPPPPLPGSPSYGRDAELVLIGLEIERIGEPAIVVGDLNDVAWSYTTTLFQRVSHMVDPRVGRGMFSTFHAKHPLARYPLDHVFHSTHFTVGELRRLPYTGSDHFPILVELAYTPARQAEAAEPRASRADRDNAEEMIDDARTAQPYVDREGRGRISQPPA